MSVANAIDKVLRDMKDDLAKTIDDETEKNFIYAGTHHRYTTISGALSRGMRKIKEDELSTKLIIDGNVSGSKAYAYAIHEGHSGSRTKERSQDNQTWKKDQYMYKTADDREDKIEKELLKDIDRAIRRFGNV